MFLFHMRRALHCQGKFRILWNICDLVYCENSQMLKADNDFRNTIQNTSLHCIGQGTLPHVSYSGCLWTLVSLLENSPLFFNMRISMWSVWNGYWFIFKKKFLKQRSRIFVRNRLQISFLTLTLPAPCLFKSCIKNKN